MKRDLSKLFVFVFVMSLLFLVIPLVSSYEDSSSLSSEDLLQDLLQDFQPLFTYNEDKVVSDTRFQGNETWWRSETSPAPTSTVNDPETDISVFFYGTPAGESPEITIKKATPFEDLKSELTSVVINQKPNTGSFEYAVINFPLSIFPGLEEGQKISRIDENGKISLLPTVVDKEAGRVFVATSHLSVFIIPIIAPLVSSIPLGESKESKTSIEKLQIAGDAVCRFLATQVWCLACLYSVGEGVPIVIVIPGLRVAYVIGAATSCLACMDCIVKNTTCEFIRSRCLKGDTHACDLKKICDVYEYFGRQRVSMKC